MKTIAFTILLEVASFYAVGRGIVLLVRRRDQLRRRKVGYGLILIVVGIIGLTATARILSDMR